MEETRVIRLEVRRLTVLSSKDLQEIAVLLARAFDAHPFFSLVYPESGSRSDVLRLLFTAAVKDALRFGQIDVAFRGKIVGVGINYPLGCYPMSFTRSLRLLPQYIRIATAGLFGFAQLYRFQIGLEKLRPRQRHSYGLHLGARQGEFVGRSLLDVWLNDADANDWPCYLETHSSKLAKYYGCLGFNILHDGIEVFRGAPLTWTMWREPRKPLTQSSHDETKYSDVEDGHLCATGERR
jgi:hypothetical protein